MLRPTLTPEQSAEADRITEILMEAARHEIRDIAELLEVPFRNPDCVEAVQVGKLRARKQQFVAALHRRAGAGREVRQTKPH